MSDQALSTTDKFVLATAPLINFSAWDRDNSGGISKDELLSMSQEKISLFGDAAELLLAHYEDARNMSSPTNDNSIWDPSAHLVFDITFRSDNSSEISEADLDAMLLVQNGGESDSLNQRRLIEQVGAAGAFLFAGVFFGLGLLEAATPTGVGQVLGVATVAAGVTLTTIGAHGVMGDSTTAYANFCQQKRDIVASW